MRLLETSFAVVALAGMMGEAMKSNLWSRLLGRRTRFKPPDSWHHVGVLMVGVRALLAAEDRQGLALTLRNMKETSDGRLALEQIHSALAEMHSIGESLIELADAAEKYMALTDKLLPPKESKLKVVK